MIRLAETRDIPCIIGMLREYSEEGELKYSEEGFSPSKTANLVSSCVKQGLVWVSEDNGLNGILAAQERLNMFSDTVREINLLVLYVTSNSRGGSVGGRLLSTYDTETTRRGTPMSWIGARVASGLTDRSLNKLGYKLQEQFYLKER